METKTVTELFSPEDIRRLENAIRRWRIALIAVSAAALTACVIFCLLTRTGNETRMELSAVVTWTLAGWFVLYQRRFALLEAKRELQHAETVRTGPRERLCGEVTVTAERLRIRGSIAIRRVSVRLDDGTEKRLNVCESGAEKLRSAGKRLTLYTVYNYVAAWEDSHEDP